MRHTRHHLPHFLMILPFLLLFGAFFLYPILSGFYYSFHDWNGVREPSTSVLRTTPASGIARLSRAMWNLFQYIAITVPLGLSVAFGLALLVDSFTGRWANFFRNAYFLPVVLPPFWPPRSGAGSMRPISACST
ncbi:hypothetical protein [Rhodobacter capsulatus]|uniref:hypothetical protein n=1 Tax=Rhodobacter capsulatus TaxID=1061 RepID=UPI004026409D